MQPINDLQKKANKCFVGPDLELKCHLLGWYSWDERYPAVLQKLIKKIDKRKKQWLLAWKQHMYLRVKVGLGRVEISICFACPKKKKSRPASYEIPNQYANNQVRLSYVLIPLLINCIKMK